MDSRLNPNVRPRHALFLGLALAFAVDTAGSPAFAAEPVRSVRAAGSPEASLDATCAWGRLADGKGRLKRCITRDEATALRDAARPTVAPVPAAAPAGSALPAGPVPPASAPLAPRVAAPVGSWPLPAPPALLAAPLAPVSVAPASVAAPDAPPSVVGPEPAAAPTESAFVAEVGPVVADEGALPDALKNLKKPRDRYAECVERNGGLTSDRGEVELRFLVQGKGRAEGVSVKKRRGVSEAAAKCVADVVDRRYVGYPEAPAVGASVVVSITKKKR